jgi:hypothetical protein
MRTTWLLVLVGAIAACSDTSTGKDDTDTEVVETDDTEVVETDDTEVVDTDVPFDPAVDLTATWEPLALTVTLAHTDATGFELGLAETASGESGWYGEDCADGSCHVVGGTTMTFDAVDDIGGVVTTGADQTTLFDADDDGIADALTSGGAHRLTYVLRVVGGTSPGDGTCYVWGDDVAYYDDLGCTAL